MLGPITKLLDQGVKALNSKCFYIFLFVINLSCVGSKLNIVKSANLSNPFRILNSHFYLSLRYLDCKGIPFSSV